MDPARCLRHLLAWPWRLRRCFPPATLSAIEQAIQASELRHGGEIRFVLEHALDPLLALKGLGGHERALQVFAQQRVWDTEANCGVLVYLLFADRDIEIVADRGINHRVAAETWQQIAHTMEARYRQGDFLGGSLSAIEEITELLACHFPRTATDVDELPNRPVLL
ncbi:MAG: hypothetical protein BWK76_27045 [Desulfobulbaceae bacterium A2]|nr:MAG: hypothetical protein BWK76_27045 [Desulfobulbaceae bacterium A2]